MFDFADIIDSSGMRIKLTSKLRQHDVGGLGIAHETSTRQVIPPQEKAFVTRAYCTQQCTTNVRFPVCVANYKSVCFSLITCFKCSRELAAKCMASRLGLYPFNIDI